MHLSTRSRFLRGWLPRATCLVLPIDAAGNTIECCQSVLHGDTAGQSKASLSMQARPTSHMGRAARQPSRRIRCPSRLTYLFFFPHPVVSSCKASRQASYLATETCVGAVVRSTRQFSSLFNNAAPSLTLTSLPGTSVYEPQHGPH